MRAPHVLSLVMLLAAAAPAAAAPSRPDTRRAAVLQSLAACRAETADAQRLACYDRAAGALDEAESKGQVVVMDRAQVQEVKRQAFGFALPSLNLFGARGGAAEERIDRVSYTVDHAGRLPNGLWMMATTEGAVWVQTDSSEELNREPRKGSTLAVRHAALSSYFCNVDGQRAVRCNRQR